MTRVRDVLDLVRAPAALTVIGDALVGAVSARRRLSPRDLVLPLASACLYSAGMALNDFADAELDASERPERPIPSGRVSRSAAFGVAAVLSAAGIGAAFAVRRSSGLVSLALAGSIWLYDLIAKPTAAGPVVMAACRGLDVMMGGAGPAWRRALLPASAIAMHTAAVTTVSRGEVNGTSRIAAAGAAATTVAAGTCAVVGASGPGALLGSAGYLSAVLPTQLAAAKEPDAVRARTATRAGIAGMIPLQTAFAVRGGSTPLTILLLSVQSIGRLFLRPRASGDIT